MAWLLLTCPDFEGTPDSVIIGEALRGISDLDESLFSAIANSCAIAGFRNLLSRVYDAVDDDAVFWLVYSDLIALKAEVADFVDDCHDAN